MMNVGFHGIWGLLVLLGVILWYFLGPRGSKA